MRRIATCWHGRQATASELSRREHVSRYPLARGLQEDPEHQSAWYAQRGKQLPAPGDRGPRALGPPSRQRRNAASGQLGEARWAQPYPPASALPSSRKHQSRTRASSPRDGMIPVPDAALQLSLQCRPGGLMDYAGAIDFPSLGIHSGREWVLSGRGHFSSGRCRRDGAAEVDGCPRTRAQRSKQVHS